MNVRLYRQGDPTYTTERQTQSRITSQITDITCTHFYRNILMVIIVQKLLVYEMKKCLAGIEKQIRLT